MNGVSETTHSTIRYRSHSGYRHQKTGLQRITGEKG